jgi:hypothetical protein
MKILLHKSLIPVVTPDTLQRRGVDLYYVEFSRNIGKDHNGNPTNRFNILLSQSPIEKEKQSSSLHKFVAVIQSHLQIHPDLITVRSQDPFVEIEELEYDTTH